ncbi:DNA-binding response regulator [Lysobacter bugurensis]|uniref:DNA-binding response regulator n=2 Tax=Cognatilysobacter bugurensis TaxID=543356 RepID=A0A918T322_9GAMM|nr:DNA-binding response regulator [Lysobacter bugurensis]
MSYQAHRILLVDDDRRLAGMLATYLHQHGVQVDAAETCEAALQRLKSGAPYVVIVLDLMLPDGDGLDLCRRIRTLGQPLSAIPIVMLTAKGDPLDRVIGLELGADDYMPKPFEPRELLARLRAVLRRPPLVSERPALILGDVRLDRDARRVAIRGAEVDLTSRQFELLMTLAEAAGRVLSREHLMDVICGEALDASDRSIDVQIGRLRAALGDDPRKPRYIATVRGVGYCFRRPGAIESIDG